MISLRTQTRSIVVAAAALVLPAALVGAPERVHAGLWEFTTTAVDAAPESVTICVSAEDAASINGGVKEGRAYAEKKAGAGCKINDYNVNGNLVAYSVTCGKNTVRARVTYAGDTSEGETVIQREGKPDIVLQLKARRVGDCPAGEAGKP